MPRKKRESEHANHERWLVSYADFITLLFAFFVVMFAVSQVDAKKLGRLAESVADATKQGNLGGRDILEGGGKPIGVIAGPRGSQAGDKHGSGASDAYYVRRFLARGLNGAIRNGRMTLARGDDGIVIRLHGAVAFEPAKAQLRSEALPDLSTLGQTLAQLHNSVRIEGHTDSVPIRDGTYSSNWDLSAARAVAVLDQLVASSGLDPGRMSIAGFGSERPIAQNETEEGRSQNRRVDIVVLTRQRQASSNEH